MGRHEGCSIDHRCPHVSQQFFGSLPSPTAVPLRKLDRLARSIRDLRVLADAIAAKGVALQAGGQAYDPSSPMGRMFFSLLAMFAEFESDLIRERTKEGMAIARAKGRLRGRAPKLKPAQEAHALALLDAGEQTPPEVAELFGVSRTTLYRAKERREARGLASVEAILPGVEVD
jgi:DNA invertase Pin-like site-specific DNA recombinase